MPHPEAMTREMVASLFLEREKFIRLARLFVGDSSLAEDIVSESVMYLLEKKDIHVESKDALRSYMMMTVRDRCLNALKTRNKQDERFRGITQADMEDLGSDEMYKGILVHEMQNLIAGSNSKMSQLSFDIFMLNRIKGMTCREIAQKYNISTGKVTRELNKALSVLRVVLQDYLDPLISGFILGLPTLLQ